MEPSKDKILSIIAAVYNDELYVQEFLESILQQSSVNWELILIDDGSTDNSGVIADEYGARFPQKIHVFHFENQGSLLARRMGINYISGEYVYFVDADDKLIPSAVEEILRAFDTYDTDAVCFTLETVQGKVQMPFRSNCAMYEAEMYPIKKYILTENGNYNSLCTKVWKKKILDKDADEYYKEIKEQKMGTDLVQLLPLLARCNSLVYINRALYWYRVNPIGITWNFKEAHFEYIRFLGQYRKKYAKSWGIPEEETFVIGKWEIFACVKHLYVKCYMRNYSYICEKLKKIENDVYFQDTMKAKCMKKTAVAYVLDILLQHRFNALVFLCLYLYRILKGNNVVVR